VNKKETTDIFSLADTLRATPKVDTSIGVKFDGDKPSMTSIPKEAMWEMGLALGYGKKKYGDGNYRNGMLVSRQLAAAVRHIYQHLAGQDKDEESGVSHIGHALASLAMAAYTLENHKNMDDRFPADKDKYK
jgi:Domain of unknown function (DUF5664)